MGDPTVIDTPANPGVGHPPGAAAGDTEAILIRNNRALELRIAGATYAQIAHTMGCAVSTAHDMVGRAVQHDTDRIADLRDQYRTVELQRLEAMVRAVWVPATRGTDVERIVRDVHGQPKLNDDGTVKIETVRVIDYQAFDRLLRVLEREAKLLGLDAPVRVAVTSETSTSITEMLADLERMLAAADDTIEVDGVEVLEAGPS